LQDPQHWNSGDVVNFWKGSTKQDVTAVFGGAENMAFADKYGTLEAYDKYIRDWE